MDLVVDLNFRMDTSALYSDIVLPAATWYEKADLNSTDMHSFIHPLTPAVPPCWESKSDWDIFRPSAKRFSELAGKHFPEPVRTSSRRRWRTTRRPRSPSRRSKDWIDGECEAIPGKTMPNLKVVERDYKNLYNQFISYGPNGPGERAGCPRDALRRARTSTTRSSPRGRSSIGATRPTPRSRDDHACNAVLQPRHGDERRAGLPLLQEHGEEDRLAARRTSPRRRARRGPPSRTSVQPRRLHQQPDVVGPDRERPRLRPFTYNIERSCRGGRSPGGSTSISTTRLPRLRRAPARPTSRSRCRRSTPTCAFSEKVGPTLMLNYLTPHGKWHIHSTYGDNQRMTTLSRGCEPFWINDKDADAARHRRQRLGRGAQRPRRRRTRAA